MQGWDQLVYLFMVYSQVRVAPFNSAVGVIALLQTVSVGGVHLKWATEALLSTVVRHMLVMQETAGS